MTAKHWKYLAITLVAANVIYWLIIGPMWSWSRMVEQELMGIKQAIARVHPEIVQQPPALPPPPTAEEKQ